MAKYKYYKREVQLSYNKIKKHDFNYSKALAETDAGCYEEISEAEYKQKDEIVSDKFNGINYYIITTYEQHMLNETTGEYESYNCSEDIDYEF